MATNFYWEYIQEVDQQIELFCEQAKKEVSDIFFIGPYNVEKSIQNLLWQQLIMGSYRSEYNTMRLTDKSQLEIQSKIFKKFFAPLLQGIKPTHSALTWNQDSITYYSKITQEYKHRIVFYCKNYRLFCYLKPLLECIPEPILLLSESELPNSIEIEGDITHILINNFNHLYSYYHDYFQSNFPHLCDYANCLISFTELFNPKAFVLIEGTHFESALIGSIARHKNIPTICLQQGWPGILHTAFRNFNYNYYLTWGKKFNSLWKTYNRYTQFIDVGYLYRVNSSAFDNPGITFFLQAPMILLDQKFFINILEWVIECVRKYPTENFFIREHPEYRLPIEIKQLYTGYKNLSFVTDLSLSEVFSMTKIGISAFSSTLIEGLTHNIIPFVIDQSSMPGYLPDVQNEKLGLYAKTIQEADVKLASLLKDKVLTKHLAQNIQNSKNLFFSGFNEETLRHIICFLQQKNILSA